MTENESRKLTAVIILLHPDPGSVRKCVREKKWLRKCGKLAKGRESMEFNPRQKSTLAHNIEL